jgi:ribonuclease P/MRP protein subunit POP5
VERLLNEAALKLLGYKGLSETDMKLVYFNEKRSRGIVRVRRDKRYAALAVLGFVRKINNEDIMFIPIATSGSLKRAKRLAEIKH